MTEPKEPFFFSNDEVWDRGTDWYAGLFYNAINGDLCGESSTHYTKLPTYPKTVERMHGYAPDAKLIYIIRHPIDRLVSQFIHEWSERKITAPIDEAIDLHSELTDYSYYAMQIEPFLTAYGADRILIVFFEHLLSGPQVELERIANFIGYAGKPHWHNDDATNVSSERLLKSPLRDAIVWNPAITWLRRKFVSQKVRDMIESLWQMEKRPELSYENYKKLEGFFDEDLSRLSQWIDVDLSCKTFKEVAKVSMPNWTDAVPNRPKQI